MTRFVRTTASRANGRTIPAVLDTLNDVMAVFVDEKGADASFELIEAGMGNLFNWQPAERITQ